MMITIATKIGSETGLEGERDPREWKSVIMVCELTQTEVDAVFFFAIICRRVVFSDEGGDGGEAQWLQLRFISKKLQRMKGVMYI